MTIQEVMEINNEIIKKIIEIISALSADKRDIQVNTKIIENKLIDSLSVFNIILNLEKCFGIKIGSMDATITDFSTPQSIAQLVLKMQKNKK